MRATLDALVEAGVTVEEQAAMRSASSANGPLKPLTLSTAPFPGFATDMQAQFMAMLTQGRRRERADRDDLREPLHARPRTRAHGRGHRGAAAAPRWCAASTA